MSIAAAGCATPRPSFRLDRAMQGNISNFGGADYLPLVEVCDAYGINCAWDEFARTAVLRGGSGTITLRTGSRRVLVNGADRMLEKPIVLDGGRVFVPLSFVKSELWPMAGEAVVQDRGRFETPKRFSIRTIVLDPGHGGVDVGAVGRRIHLREDKMNLMLALKLKGMLEREVPKVIMTRDKNVFVPLPKRAEMANRKGADLFVSVHMNSSRSKSLRGFECYFLSNALDDNRRALDASRESSFKPGEGAVMERSKQLDRTLWDMKLMEDRRESAQLAGYICDSIERNLTMSNRGVRSARFYVLKYTRMPAVLVEAGYLSNKYEEMKLQDPRFLNRVAEAIAQGILRYKKEYEKTEGFTNMKGGA